MRSSAAIHDQRGAGLVDRFDGGHRSHDNTILSAETGRRCLATFDACCRLAKRCPTIENTRPDRSQIWKCPAASVSVIRRRYHDIATIVVVLWRHSRRERHAVPPA